MTRSLSLEPKFIAGRNKPWRVWIPKYLSDTGKTKRLFYKTKREAQTAADLVRIRAENFGRKMVELTPAQMATAKAALDILAEHPSTSLLDAVRGYMMHQGKRNASVPWTTLIDQFLATKQGRSPKHRRNLRYTQERFAHLGPRKVSDVTAAELAPILDSLLPATRNLELRHLRSIFAFAKKRGWTDENPAEKLDFVQIIRSEVEIFTPNQVDALLSYALHNDPGLIPFFTFGFFCGIRPEGELLKLDWGSVHFTGQKAEVEIPPGVSKTKKRRFIDLSENAIAWLDAYRHAGGETTGPLIAYTPSVLRKHRRAALTATGFQWIQQGMRHTYCSAWLAKYRDVNRLVLMSGHDDPDTLWRFYHRGISEKEADRFWAIVPEGITSKIVAFQASQDFA